MGRGYYKVAKFFYLNTACEEHVGVDGCEVLCEFHLPYFHLTGWAGDRGIKIAHALTVPFQAVITLLKQNDDLTK